MWFQSCVCAGCVCLRVSRRRMELLTMLSASLGTLQLAATSIAFTLYLLLWCPYIGVGGAASCLVGLCIGANDPSKARRVAFTSLAITVS